MMDRSIADDCGFGAIARTAIVMFDTSRRGAGRTHRMIERLSDEDQVVCPNEQIARYVRDALKRAGKPGTRVLVVDPRRSPLESAGTAPRGRTFFEHTWVFEYYLAVLGDAERHLEGFARAMSKTWPQAPDADPDGNRIRYMAAEWRA